MHTGKPEPRGPQGRNRASVAGAVVAMLAMLAVTGALAGPAAATPSDSATEQARVRIPAPPSAGSVRATPGELNVAMLAMAAGLGLAISAPVACRGRLAAWVTIPRFRAELGRADVVAVLPPATQCWRRLASRPSSPTVGGTSTDVIVNDTLGERHEQELWLVSGCTVRAEGSSQCR